VISISKMKNACSFAISKSPDANPLTTCKTRLFVVLATISFVYFILVFRLFDISLSSREDIKNAANKRGSNTEFFIARSSITDRNGTLLAVNLNTASLYANPQRVIDKERTSQQLCQNLSAVSCKDITQKISSDKGFAWIKRHLTPREQQIIHNLGIPGLYFINEEKRVYPQKNLFAHVLGYVDVDGHGLAGVEKFFDNELRDTGTKNLELAVDSRIQQILREEIAKQMHEHSALGGSGIIMDANTGEVIAMVSLPDFDPHHIHGTTDRQRFNQASLGAYEMGSTFKVLTMAMAFEGKHVGINDAFNLDVPIMIGSHKLSDYKGKGGFLTVPEILMYSSNIGTAQVAMRVGLKSQKNFLNEFGLLNLPEIELPEKSRPLYPSEKMWNHASMLTISFGHGIAVTPVHVAKAMAAVVNGGKLVKPTLLKIEDPQDIEYKQVLSEQTSGIMKKLLRLVVTNGSGKKANIDGYMVGGKTGTSEKIIGKRYAKNANIASFMGAFPIDDPKYVIVVLIDEAESNKKNGGYTTGGMIAAPVAGEVISRAAPILGVAPRDISDPQTKQKTYLEFNPKRPLAFPQ
jgi:cell division protein FtsI (penicillin-binding protein 3)